MSKTEVPVIVITVLVLIPFIIFGVGLPILYMHDRNIRQATFEEGYNSVLQKLCGEMEINSAYLPEIYLGRDEADDVRRRCVGYGIMVINDIGAARRVYEFFDSRDLNVAAQALKRWEELVRPELETVRGCERARRIWEESPPTLKEQAALKVLTLCLESPPGTPIPDTSKKEER